MLKTAVDDFQAAGYSVVSLLDSRLNHLTRHLNADEVVSVPPSTAFQEALNHALKSSDMSLIIAPETGGALSNLVQSANLRATLNSTPDSINKVSDKAGLADALRRNGLPTPEARCLSIDDGSEAAVKVFREFSSWVVVKPVDGVGCESVSLVKNVEELKQAVQHVSSRGQTTRFLIQKFADGLAASVSLISNGVYARPVSLNLQHVSLNPPSKPSSYLGGVVPLVHPDAEKAFDVARRSVELFRGLRGYVGVDMILTPRGPLILEVNPRLTVSYVGLRRVTAAGLAEAMVESARGEGVPLFELNGVSVFSKVRSKEATGLMRGVEVLCPPLRIDGEELAYTLVVATGKTESEARRMLKDAAPTDVS